MSNSFPLKATPEHEMTINTATADKSPPKEPELEIGKSLPKNHGSTPKWTRKRIAYLSAGVAVAVIIIVLVITLPVTLTRSSAAHDDDDDDDVSYHFESNRPRRVLGNFPDPGLIRVNNGSWFAFATNPAINNTKVPRVPVAMSHNFTNWTKYAGYDALPTLAPWERKANHFAPDVIQRDDGKYILYYAGELKDWKTHHCVGAAISESNSPIGPYRPQNTTLACPKKKGGAIDPSPFRDVDGKLYVTYKIDGNSIGHGGVCNNSKKPLVRVQLMLQELKEDGITPVGDPIQILESNKRDDGPLVESPNLVRTPDGVYYLFFSSHCFVSPKYDVKYAFSSSVKGPYTRAKRALLQSGDFGLKGPGGATVSTDGRKMVFHANCDDVRCMYIAGIHINSTVPGVTLSAL